MESCHFFAEEESFGESVKEFATKALDVDFAAAMSSISILRYQT